MTRPKMRVLAFGDVLGNPHAAQAILGAAKRLDGECDVVCLGNAFGPGPDAPACVERLRKGRVLLVRGAWDMAATNMPAAPADLRLQAKPLAAKLAAADLAYLREATPPRRLIAGGKRILLTSETKPDAGQADVVIHAGPKAFVKKEPTRLDIAVGNASEAPDGESPYILFDSDTGEARVHFAAWDLTVLRRRGK